MIASAKIAFDRDYFETHYKDSLIHRTKWRRYEIWFATILVLFGVTLAIVFTQHWMVGIIFTAAGVCEFVMAATHRRRWIKSRLSTTRDNKVVRLKFNETEMTVESPLGSSTMRYAGFDDFTVGSHGFFSCSILACRFKCLVIHWMMPRRMIDWLTSLPRKCAR